ncbi:hypothetical protein [Streptomyces sp. R33]|uniref:Uncharacterized protein n=1 Tax=Streptomyces sp. R33 TaxID=3238629 RepID=A0AB39YGC3_9ACTN
MNEIITAAADILTIIGSALTITLEIRHARMEARKADRGDAHEDTQE